MKRTHSPVMILAGGTGGHVFPALAVAKKIEQQSVPIVWVGTRKGIESKVVVKAGYPLEWISVSGLRGKGLSTILIAPFKLLLVIFQAARLILKYKPCAVLGMGGFVAGPAGLIAVLLRRPLIIHEQNAIVGLTNRILAPFAKRILAGFPSTFMRNNVEVVGNPVREEISEIEREREIAEPSNLPIHVLIVGGSLGAQVFNQIVPEALALIPENVRPDIWHQSGEDKLAFTQKNYLRNGVQARISEFIDSMSDAYAWADLVICRAGAITIAELAIAGVGAIFVPYPYAVDDHQTANATSLVNTGAAYLIQENELDPIKLAQYLQEVSVNRKKLKAIAKAVREFAKPQAADDVANICLQACMG